MHYCEGVWAPFRVAETLKNGQRDYSFSRMIRCVSSRKGVGVHWRNLFEVAPVSDGLNARDLVNKLLLGFALIELRQEVLQIAHFFDVVLKPSLAFSVREQKRTQ